MKPLIFSDPEKCVGCNRCTRFCPIETANITAIDESGNIKVNIDNDKCIGCGACVATCHHGARSYYDDTERLIADLKTGKPISLIVAPAFRPSLDKAGRILTWLRDLGVRRIYDVSVGADICTWAHIRAMETMNLGPIISQPCPPIVNYCLMYKPELAQKLSPVQSPMNCVAIYMKKYEGIYDSIAAISPCIAKAHEFESTGLVQYNVTFKKLTDYIEKNGIILPMEESVFDHPREGLGSIFSMPGGLKENIEHFLDKKLRIDKRAGQSIYHALDEYALQNPNDLPDLFDVLNCADGCNDGTGCAKCGELFKSNAVMDDARQSSLLRVSKEEAKEIYSDYDRRLNLDHFLRSYRPAPVNTPDLSEAQIDEAFRSMGKTTYTEKTFDCGACGSEKCIQMARKIALKVNIPENCAQKSRDDIKHDHKLLLETQNKNVESVTCISNDIRNIKESTDVITDNLSAVNSSISAFTDMAKVISSIAAQINIISLNASIEAARAGEHGKTFSVIAAEIRRLSESSKATVSQSANMSKAATDSVAKMNSVAHSILDAVQTAHSNIEKVASGVDTEPSPIKPFTMTFNPRPAATPPKPWNPASTTPKYK
jgi:ferredoxin